MHKFMRIFTLLVTVWSVITIGILVVITFWQVINRYILESPSAWTVEINRFLFPWLCMLGAAKVLGEKEHYDIAVLTNLLPPQIQRYLEKVIDILVFIFLVILSLWGIKFLAVSSKRMSPILGIGENWMYLSVPVGAILMILYMIIRIYENYQKK